MRRLRTRFGLLAAIAYASLFGVEPAPTRWSGSSLMSRAPIAQAERLTGTMHFILAVIDHGTPRLTRYARVIVEVTN